MIHILPFSDDMIEFLACMIMNDAGGNSDLSDYIIVFPNKKPGLHLLKKLSEKAKATLVPPAIFSIDNFFRHLSRAVDTHKREISSFEAVIIIYSLIKNRMNIDEFREMNLNTFYEWGIEIYKFFEELLSEGIQDQNIKDKFNSFYTSTYDEKGIGENLPELFSLYKKALEDKKLTTTGTMYSSAESFSYSDFERYHKVIFAGFFDPTESEIAVIKNLSKRIEDRFILLLQDEKDRLSRPIERMIKISGKDPIFQKPEIISAPEISIIEGFDTHSQVLGLKNALKKNNDSDDICIVLPEASSLIPVLYDIVPDLEKKFNISLGYPVTLTPLYKTVLKILNLQKNAKTSENIKYYLHSDYLELIQDGIIRFLSLDGIDEDLPINTFIPQIITFIMDNEILNICPGNLIEQIRSDNSTKAEATPDSKQKIIKLLSEFHRLFIEGFDSLLTFQDFSRQLYRIISLISEKGNIQELSFGKESIDTLVSSLAEMHLISMEGRGLESSDMVSLLIKMLSDSYISLTGAPLAEMQILGILETRCLSFDNTYILDFNEGSLPKFRQSEPLIPNRLREMLKISHRQRKNQIYRYHVNRLIKSSKNASLIYNNSMDRERSRFMEEILWNFQIKKEKPPEIKNISLYINPRLINEITISKSDEVIDILGNLEYTATKIDTYLNCPLRFYFRYILNIESEDTEIGEINHIEIGRLVHKVLEYAFKQYRIIKDANVNFDLTNFFNDINEHFEYLLDQSFKNKQVSSLFLFRAAFRNYLKNFIKTSIDYLENSNAEIIHIEEHFQKILSIDHHNFKVSGKIDRIDKFSNFWCIFDYKTGKSFFKNYKWPVNTSFDGLKSRSEIKNSFNSLQLPVYMFLFDKFPCDAFYISFRNFESLSKGIIQTGIKELYSKGNKNELTNSRSLIYDHYLPVIKAIIKEMNDQAVPFCQDMTSSGNCNYCPYRRLCL